MPIVDFKKTFKKGGCYYPNEMETINKYSNYFIAEEDLFSSSEQFLVNEYGLSIEEIKEAKEFSKKATDDFHVCFKNIKVETLIEVIE